MGETRHLTGAGAGVVCAFLWNWLAVARGAPEMPAEVSPFLGGMVWFLLTYLGRIIDYFVDRFVGIDVTGDAGNGAGASS